MRVVSLALACMLVMAGAAHAQNLSFGSINGTVTDTSGGALPGVTVTASSPALQVGQLTAVTDGEGKYQVVDLPRGDHVIYHTSLDVPELVPATGLERVTRAFAAALDRANKMTMAQLRGPNFPPKSGQGTLTGIGLPNNAAQASRNRDDQ